MNDLEEREEHCPYCGETINVLIDRSVPHQNYIEDCQICCQPITFDVTVEANGGLTILLLHENE